MIIEVKSSPIVTIYIQWEQINEIYDFYFIDVHGLSIWKISKLFDNGWKLQCS